MIGDLCAYEGCETIMVVDDEECLRDFYSELFADLGYNVITAKDGNDAVEKYKLHADSVKAVLMDVVMPHKDGISAYFEMKELRPNIHIMLYSGNSCGLTTAPKVWQKPISPVVVAKEIRAGLDAVSLL